MAFKALLATKTAEKISTALVEMNENDLMPADVTVAVDYSTVNYKDAMALSGRADVIKQFPLIPGIDLAGTVETSSYPGIEIGDRVVANSWGLSQTHHGGYAQKARLSGHWLIKIPAPLSTKDAMAIGTAGYTAMPSFSERTFARSINWEDDCDGILGLRPQITRGTGRLIMVPVTGPTLAITSVATWFATLNSRIINRAPFSFDPSANE